MPAGKSGCRLQKSTPAADLPTRLYDDIEQTGFDKPAGQNYHLGNRKARAPGEQ
jgi:hypothetical protein